MQARITQFTAPIRHVLDRLLPGAQLVIRVAIRGWQWLMSLDIPLSPLQWILLFFLSFGVIYALATPVFEANEEIWHFGYIEHLRKKRRSA